jgi:hypothetical protein
MDTGNQYKQNNAPANDQRSLLATLMPKPHSRISHVDKDQQQPQFQDALTLVLKAIRDDRSRQANSDS